MRLLICKDCKKPDGKAVAGKARCGKKLLRELCCRDGLPFRVEACSCLGKCKKGPNGLLLPGEKRLHHLSVKAIKKLVESS
jgi:predicted metal-binding protein